MAEIDNTGRPAYVYNSADGKWYEVAGKVDPTANYNWTGTHTFNSPVTINNSVIVSKRFNVFTNQTTRSAAMQTLGTSDRGHISFLQNDATTGTALNRLEYYSGDAGTGWLGVVPVGTIVPYAGPTAPPGWLLCDGTSYVRANYQDLYNIVSTTYGGGTVPGTTFQVPNLTGRVAVGSGDSELGSSAGSSSGWKKSQSHTHDYSHTHGVSSPYTAGTNEAGSHGHGFVTQGDHSHSGGTSYSGYSFYYAITEDRQTFPRGTQSNVTVLNDITGYGTDHSHSFSTNTVGNHNHGFVTDGAHTHITVHQNSTTTSSYPTNSAGSAGSTSAIGNMPPYLTLNYIIRY